MEKHRRLSAYIFILLVIVLFASCAASSRHRYKKKKKMKPCNCPDFSEKIINHGKNECNTFFV